MIVIKIRTWKDYKKQFLDWLKEPRQEVCEQFVFMMEQTAQDKVDLWIAAACDTHGISDEAKLSIISAAQRGIIEARNEIIEDIKEWQPKGVFK